MVAAKRRLFHAFRISRKLAFLSGSFLLLLGASGTAALIFAPAGMIPGFKDDTGGHCKTVYQSEFRRGKERRVIAVISTNDLETLDRVRTGMRITAAQRRARSCAVMRLVLKLLMHRTQAGRWQYRSLGRRAMLTPCQPHQDSTSETVTNCGSPNLKPSTMTLSWLKAVMEM